MDYVVIFFRDILDGPLYIAVVILNVIFICSCIGYLGERYLNKKKEKAKFAASYVKINDPTKQKNAQKVMVNSTAATNAQANVNVGNVTSVSAIAAVGNQMPQTGAINKTNTVNQTSTLNTQNNN